IPPGDRRAFREFRFQFPAWALPGQHGCQPLPGFPDPGEDEYSGAGRGTERHQYASLREPQHQRLQPAVELGWVDQKPERVWRHHRELSDRTAVRRTGNSPGSAVRVLTSRVQAVPIATTRAGAAKESMAGVSRWFMAPLTATLQTFSSALKV